MIAHIPPSNKILRPRWNSWSILKNYASDREHRTHPHNSFCAFFVFTRRSHRPLICNMVLIITCFFTSLWRGSSKVTNIFAFPVMWLLQSLSRYHASSTHPLEHYMQEIEHHHFSPLYALWWNFHLYFLVPNNLLENHTFCSSNIECEKNYHDHLLGFCPSFSSSRWKRAFLWIFRIHIISIIIVSSTSSSAITTTSPMRTASEWYEKLHRD